MTHQINTMKELTINNYRKKILKVKKLETENLDFLNISKIFKMSNKSKRLAMIVNNKIV